MLSAISQMQYNRSESHEAREVIKIGINRVQALQAHQYLHYNDERESVNEEANQVPKPFSKP